MGGCMLYFKEILNVAREEEGIQLITNHYQGKILQGVILNFPSNRPEERICQ